jgi:hypothetical protein
MKAKIITLIFLLIYMTGHLKLLGQSIPLEEEKTTEKIHENLAKQEFELKVKNAFNNRDQKLLSSLIFQSNHEYQIDAEEMAKTYLMQMPKTHYVESIEFVKIDPVMTKKMSPNIPLKGLMKIMAHEIKPSSQKRRIVGTFYIPYGIESGIYYIPGAIYEPMEQKKEKQL